MVEIKYLNLDDRTCTNIYQESVFFEGISYFKKNDKKATLVYGQGAGVSIPVIVDEEHNLMYPAIYAKADVSYINAYKAEHLDQTILNYPTYMTHIKNVKNAITDKPLYELFTPESEFPTIK